MQNPRVQSPSVGESIKKLLGLSSNPASYQVLPAVLPVVNQPLQEYYLFCSRETGIAADGAKTVVTVPSDEDWLLTSLSFVSAAGDGHIDYVYVTNSDQSKWANRASLSAYQNHYIMGEIANADFPFIQHYGGIPLPSGSVLAYYYDFAAVNAEIIVTGTFLRRKW